MSLPTILVDQDPKWYQLRREFACGFCGFCYLAATLTLAAFCVLNPS